MKKDSNRYQKFHIILGQNIKNLRVLKNMSQEELAFKISTARNYIGCIERAQKRPSLDIIFDIAKALDCKLCDLFPNI